MVQLGFDLEAITSDIDGILAEIDQRVRVEAINPEQISHFGKRMTMAYKVSNGVLTIWTDPDNVFGHYNLNPERFHALCISVEHNKVGPDFAHGWCQFTLII